MEILNNKNNKINTDKEDKEFFVDSHCHLQFFSEEELKLVLTKCKENKIKYLCSNSTSDEDFEKTIELVNQSSKNLNTNVDVDDEVVIIPGIGYHPW